MGKKYWHSKMLNLFTHKFGHWNAQVKHLLAKGSSKIIKYRSNR